MSGNTPNDQPRPSRWKLYFSLTFLALAGAAGTVAWIELQESNFQAEYFHQQARTSTWKLEPGADSGIWLPSSGGSRWLHWLEAISSGPVRGMLSLPTTSPRKNVSEPTQISCRQSQ